MKAIIIYYSYTGNTKLVAEDLVDILQEKGEVATIELKDLTENGNFLSQAAKGFRHKRAEIQPVQFDLKNYDLICFGTPVWAFGPAPAINSHIDRCVGLGDKVVILFTTYGSGAGREHCLNYMKGILAKKGVREFMRFSIQQREVRDRELVLRKIKEALRL